MFPPDKPHRATAGFTLVEIVLALGIISFGLVALVGLLAVSLDSSRSSDQDTMIASMARQVTTTLRERPFDKLKSGGSSDIFYFDAEGRALPAATPEARQGAVYQCTAILTRNADFDTVETNGTSKPNLFDVQLRFSTALKPATSATPAAMEVVNTAIARYEPPIL
ncbi:MAG: hypothetical protein QOE70_2639 [Chthoniobacter sp.]|jgi:uncharacterized protein (TIGR02598 family)|nr:hypothetical protein [Chthoniobacter sp.]